MGRRQDDIREAVGLFDNMAGLQEAVNDLEGRSFPRDSISVMGGRGEVEKVFGAAAVPPEMAERDPDTPRQPPVRTEEKAIGAGVLIGGGLYLGAVAAAFATGGDAGIAVPAVVLWGAAGGLAGGLLALFLRRRFERQVAAQLEKGGLLLWVRTPDRRHERLARAVLKARGARHVHMQKVPPA